jgi:hypothetical protein
VPATVSATVRVMNLVILFSLPSKLDQKIQNQDVCQSYSFEKCQSQQDFQTDSFRQSLK